MRGRDLGDHPAPFGQIAGSQREPRNEPDPLRLAIVEDVISLSVREVVEVLHRGDVEDLLRCLDLLDRDLRQTEMADLALVLEFLHEPELLLAGNLRVDAVQLPQVDGLDTEPAQAHEATLAQVLRAPDLCPDTWAVARKAALRRDVDAVEGVQGLVDEVLGVLRSVRVGGVDEIDTKLRQSLEDGDRCVAVFRRAPNAIASDPHGAKAET